MVKALVEGKDVKAGRITDAHYALYKCMKSRFDNSEQFTQDDMMLVYSAYVVAPKRSRAREDIPVEQVYLNASAWTNHALSKLVRAGYLGLTFKIHL